VKEYRGRALDAAAARAQLDRYHAELIAGLRASNGGYAPRGRGTA
ncbi:cyclolysin-activating lysine-acyltransferase CyaC, partial [Bordetella pertussis]